MLHAYNPPGRFLPYLSWTEIAALPDPANTVIVLPTGATEQHGPHLPCAVDTIISAGVIGHALARLPPEVPAFAMAPITYGKSEEHLHFPGTITLTGETLLATMIEIAESVYRAGFRKLLIVNGHGGQPQVMEIMAREMRLRHGDHIVVPQSTWRLPNVAGRYLADREKKLAMHAGHAETAIMLALAPDTVHMERAVTKLPARISVEAALARRPPGLRLDGPRLRSERRHRRPIARNRRARPRHPRFAGRELGTGDHRVAPHPLAGPRRGNLGSGAARWAHRGHGPEPQQNGMTFCPHVFSKDFT